TLQHHPGAAIQQLGSEAVTRQLIAPLFKGTFRIFHDVALVNQRHRRLVMVNRILDRSANQSLSPLFRHWFDSDPATFGKADLGNPHLFLQELNHFLGFRTIGLPFNARINVFGVLPKNHHIGQLRMLDRTGHPSKPTDGPNTGIEVQLLTQSNVQRTYPSADGGRQGAFDTDRKLTQRLKGFFRQPDIVTIYFGGLFAAINFHPHNSPLGAITFTDSAINHFAHDRCDINTNTIPFDKRNDRKIWHIQGKIPMDGNFVTIGRNLDLLVSHVHSMSICDNEDKAPYLAAERASMMQTLEYKEAVVLLPSKQQTFKIA